ncbi:MAG TPA: winged helix-turn-helix domain-containing protein [Pyrinomonadaceae bacterium]|nr:winged helix-turn-helix domain-containing protein [Pyrinomonadaceae bacterium]
MSKKAPHIYRFGPYQLNAGEKLLLRDGEELPVKPKVVDTLIALIRNNGHVVSKEELLQALWPDSFVEESNLTHNISLLRRVLDEKGSGESYIQTVPKRGYRFVGEVKESFHEIEDVTLDETTRVKRQTAFRMKATLLNHKFAISCICLIALLCTGLYFFVSRQRVSKAAASNIRLVAVVPFKVVGDRSNDEYLGLGMADSLINRLNSLRQLTILPTSSVARFTGREFDARDIGKKLQVDAVLEGTVQNIDKRVLVTATLIDLRSGNTLWAGKFDEQFTDIFFLQDSISEKVVRALEIELSADRQNKLSKRYTNSTEAYQLYSIGLHHWNKRTAEGFQKALELFHLATEKDPKFALAFATLADVYVLIDFYGYDFVSASERRAKGLEMAQKALALDDNLAESHAAMGAVYARFMKKYLTAERYYKRAIDLSPNFGTAYVRYGYLLLALGRIDEALQQLHLAREFDPMSATILTNISACYLYQRKHAEALKYSKLVLEIDPEFYHALDNLASAYMYQSMYAEAEDVFRKIAARDRTRLFGEERLAYFLAYVGRRSEAQELLKDLVKHQQERNAEPTPTSLAQVYAVLGENERAVKILSDTAETDGLLLPDLRLNQDFDSLRSTASFQELLRREELKLKSKMN